jgi:tetratricopeptide (TPR) repeat protein
VARLGPEQLTAEGAFYAAISHRALGDAPSAADWYGRAVQLRPTFAEVRVGTSVCRRASEPRESSLMLSRSPLLATAAQAYLNGAFVLSEAGRTADAIESYRAGLRLRSWLAETAGAAHNNLGVLLRDAGRHDEAVASFEAAVRARPDLREATENLRIARAGEVGTAGSGGFLDLIRRANKLFADASRAGGNPSGYYQAAELYRQATGMRDPRVDGAAYVGLGAALHGARRIDEALEVRPPLLYCSRGWVAVLPLCCSTGPG